MKLSIIVPVYNVERFLPRCLDSLLRQGLTAEECEIICVNDGSPDGSAKILADYAERYPDLFRVITQENQGLGGARNTGTALAQGEYITYIDSDDYIIDNAYSYLLENFCQPNVEGVKPDVLVYTHKIVHTDGTTLLDPEAKPDGTVIFEGDGAELYCHFALPFVWTKFYRRDYMLRHHIKSEIVICQDEIFNYDIFSHHPYTRRVSCNVCRYEQNNGDSIQKTVQKDKVLKQLEELFYDLDLMNRHLQEADDCMVVVAQRAINNFLNVYYKKILSVRLSHSEWKHVQQRLKALALPDMHDVYGSSSGKAIATMKNMSGHSYVVYCFVSFFYQKIFLKYILPKI